MLVRRLSVRRLVGVAPESARAMVSSNDSLAACNTHARPSVRLFIFLLYSIHSSFALFPSGVRGFPSSLIGHWFIMWPLVPQWRHPTSGRCSASFFCCCWFVFFGLDSL